MILLKKSLNEVLKTHNLPGIYVERIDRTGGMLNLCGPCGKPLMPIPDVRIPHSKLTIDEREYVLTELSIFIMDNVKTIKEIIKINTSPIEQKEYPGYKIGVNRSNDYHGDRNRTFVRNATVKTSTTNDSNYNSDNPYIMVTLNSKNIFKLDVNNLPMDNVVNEMDKITEMRKIAKECFATGEKILKQEERLDILKTCKI